MKILLLSAYFPPELGSASNLFYQLGTEFVKRGHEVTVLTSFPTYHVSSEADRSKYGKGLWMGETVNGMQVIRIRPFEGPRHIPVFRGISQISTAIAYAFSGIFLASGKFDVALVYSPPLFLGSTAIFLRGLRARTSVVNIQDLFPQSAIDLGVLKSGLLIDIFRKIESRIYRTADAVTVHSEGNRQHVISCRGNADRTHVVPNLVDTNEITPGERMNDFRRRYDIPEEAYVVSFAGVIGYSQDLDTVIEAAKTMTDLKNVLFLIVGDGVEKPRLVKKAEGLENIRFIPMIPKDEYVTLLHASDLCLATLHKEVKTPVVPSKILSIMSAGRAVLAGLPLEGDAPKIINEAKCGICVEPEVVPALADAIRTMYSQPQLTAEYGRNGRTYVVNNFSLEICTTYYEQLFSKLLKK